MKRHLLFSVLALSLAGCGGNPASPGLDAGSPDSGRGSTPDGGNAPDGGASPDAGLPPVDAGTHACPSQQGSNDAGADQSCALNSDCPATQRCECDNGDCLCRTGARGMGCPGVDTCTVGEDCASSVCAEGNGGKYYCSGTCTTNADCGPALPVCQDIAFIGRICTRQP